MKSKNQFIKVMSVLIAVSLLAVLFGIARLKIVQWVALGWMFVAIIYQFSKLIYQIILVFQPENKKETECRK